MTGCCGFHGWVFGHKFVTMCLDTAPMPVDDFLRLHEQLNEDSSRCDAGDILALIGRLTPEHNTIVCRRCGAKPE